MIKRNRVFSITLVVASVLAGSVIAMAFPQEAPKRRKVTRVRRPVFTDRDWDGIYFEDVFRDGLVGNRPKKIEPGTSTNPSSVAGTNSNPAENSNVDSGDFVWSDTIPDFVIEDEVKRLQQNLEQEVTSPGKFKSEYSKARQSFSMLSMMFAIIRQYDGDVRWKRHGPQAQVAFARTAANARVGSQQAYQSAKRRKDDLAEIIRGGNFEANEEIPEVLEWPLVVDRSPMMVRLQESIDKIRPMMASKLEFSKNVETIEHEASLIAAMGEILTREGMDEADDDDYVALSKQMLTASKQVAEAAKNENYELASPAFNSVTQSCSNCHEDWR